MGDTVVVVPVCSDDVALDACLAALDESTAPGTKVWLPDNMQVTQRGFDLIKSWITKTRLTADYTRRTAQTDPVTHMAEVLAGCGEADVAVLSPFSVPFPGWLNRLEACFASDASIATATPWSNLGDVLSWPSVGEIQSIPDGRMEIAQAAANMPRTYPEIPAAIPHCAMIRGAARARTGSLDATSFRSWYAALVDLSLRFSGMGWRNVLCESAFVGSSVEEHALEGDSDALFARWPDWQARQAHFVLNDPIQPQRRDLGRRLDAITPPDLQRDLFETVGEETAAP